MPPYIPHKNTLRKCISRELNMDISSNVFNCLRTMKHCGDYAGTIKQISLDNFLCWYWSLLQIVNYKNVRKFLRIELDATGTLAQSVWNPTGENHARFLHQIVMPETTGTAPVAQMILERDDTNTIAYRLGEFLKDAPTPNKAVADYSLALLNVMTLSFNHRSLNLLPNAIQWFIIRSCNTLLKLIFE